MAAAPGRGGGGASPPDRPFVLGARPQGPLAASRQGSGLGAGRAGSSKKLSIKPFRAPPQVPDGFEAACWAKLHDAVLATQHTRAAAHTQEELYAAVRDLCEHRHGKACAEKLRGLVEAHTAAQVEALREAVSGDGAAFLASFGRTWDAGCQQLLTLKQIFAHLDRAYLLQHGQRSLWDQGLEIFADALRQREGVLRKLRQSLLGLIRHEREGNAVDRGLAAKLTRMLCDLGMYREHFEAPFLAATRSFYEEEGRSAVRGDAQFQVARYLHLVEQRLGEEEARVQHYLDHSTRRPLLAEAETCLVRAHAAEVVQKGCAELIDGAQLAELRLLHRHLGLPNVQRRDTLRSAFKAYIKAKGAKRVQDEQSDPTLIADLLAFKAKLDQVLRDAFESQQEFLYALRDSFEAFVNLRANRPSELLAKFLDGKMRAVAKETEDELEPTMDACLDLFRMFQSKDVFLAFYQKDFAKRLLLGRSASVDNEKAFIAKLKQEGGPGFTLKLEGMMADMEVSGDLMKSFKDHLAKRAEQGLPPPGGDASRDVDLNVHVLTQSYWPTQTPVDGLRIPQHIGGVLELFKTFYLSRHKGRRLLWQANLCMCTVKAAFPKGRKELIVSLFQALVLLLLNDRKELSFAEAKECTGVEDAELRRVLQSLALGSVRPLRRKQKGGREIVDGDVFSVNEDFAYRQYKIKVNQVQLRETPEEAKRTNEQVFQDRVYAVDACIVRTMKSRRSMVHTDLVASVFGALKFPVQGADVKKRIESLIDRDYLRRDDEKTNQYHYIA